MKKNYSVAAKFFAGSALAVGLTFSALAQSERSVPSTVMRVAGNARCSVDGGVTWKLLKAGDIIYASALVQTARGADLDLLLGEQVKAPAKGTTFSPESRPCHFISLAADTVLKLEKITRTDASAVDEILLEVRTGTINGNVRKMEAGSKYEVAFAGGVAGMREAIYRLSSGGQLNVMKGKAFVAMNNSPEVKVVEAGSELAPKTPVAATIMTPPSAQVSAPAPIHAPPAATSVTPTKETTAQRVPLPRSGLRRAAP